MQTFITFTLILFLLTLFILFRDKGYDPKLYEDNEMEFILEDPRDLLPDK